MTVETVNKTLLYNTLLEEVVFLRKLMKRKDETIRELVECLAVHDKLLNRTSAPDPRQLTLRGIAND